MKGCGPGEERDEREGRERRERNERHEEREEREEGDLEREGSRRILPGWEGEI